ncbi:hypothetical protein N9500_02950 [Candidatus Pelagibacter sp.]|nr:hypothetical protein [Candidatus Pelagibacter sp.]
MKNAQASVIDALSVLDSSKKEENENLLSEKIQKKIVLIDKFKNCYFVKL